MSRGGRPSPAREDPLDALAGAIRAILLREPSADERGKFAVYLKVLRRWNRVHGLTGLRSPEAMVRGLFQDSLLFFPLLPPHRPLDVVDIGAGAGIPGVPLRIVDPGIRLTLIEARRKRVSFLLALGRELGLGDVRVVHGRAESLLVEDPGLAAGFDAAVVRAVGSLPKLLHVALRYLKPEGQFIASGPPAGVGQPEGQVLGRGAWRVVEVPSLGVKRRFLVAGRGTTAED